MKKLASIIAAVLTAGTLAATGITASACGAGHGNRGNGGCHSYTGTYTANIYPTARHYFVDANHDGICDNCGSEVCLSNGLCSGYHSHGYFVDANNDGFCDNCGSGTCLSNGLCSGQHNHYFVDANGDGICDNCGGTCLSNGQCSGHHTYGYFIDANGDGICDNCAAGQCAQHGTRTYSHHGWGCHR